MSALPPRLLQALERIAGGGRPRDNARKCRLRKPLARGRPCLLALDFDGTLAPLAPRPDLARLPALTRGLLSRLAERPGMRLAVLSGRGLKDVRARVGLPRLCYSGNHGLEISGPGWRWTHPEAARAAGLLGMLARAWRRKLSRLPGLIVEAKGLSLSLHYRGASARDAAQALRLVRSELKSHAGVLRLGAGRKVWEVRPRLAWTKGHAILKIRRFLGGFGGIIFIGDDETDEEGFRHLGRRAVSVLVGRGRRSRARFRLKDPAGVREVLQWLLRSRS